MEVLFMDFEYQVGGTLDYDHSSYVKRDADTQLSNALKAGEFCYVLNARQMGKSSLQIQALEGLPPDQFQCASIDLSDIGTNTTDQQWYYGFIEQLVRVFSLSHKVDIEAWWKQRDLLTPVQRLSHFIEDVFLVEISQNIVIFVDEIDTTLRLNFTDDFFALIRSFYNKRALNPEYKRLTFCLLGVAAPSDLIQDEQRTPFNIGTSIDLKGFTQSDAAPLAEGLKEIVTPPTDVLDVLAEILEKTGGQPFLTQFFCQLLVTESQISDTNVTQIFQYIVENWSIINSQDHFQTIQRRLLEDYQNRKTQLLEIYHNILLSPDGKIPATDSLDETKLRLTGLVVKDNGCLKVYNPIYAQIFNRDWVQQKLTESFPFQDFAKAWKDSDYKEDYLLRGDALEKALDWEKRNKPNELQQQFINASRDDKIKTLEKAHVQAKKIISLAQEATQIEREGVQVLREFNTQAELEALTRGVKAGEKLQQLLHNWKETVQDQPELLNTIPARSPQFTLREILTQIREKCQLIGHSQWLTGVSFSPNGEYLATCSSDGTAKLWAIERGEEIRTFRGHSQWVTGVSFSTNGAFLATCSHDGTAKLWAIKRGEEIRTFRGDSQWVTGVSFSTNGAFLATCSQDETAKLWAIERGEEIRTFRGDSQVVWGESFSTNGEFLATCSEDGTAKLWDLQGNLIAEFRGYRGNLLRGEPDFVELKSPIRCLCFSRDGKFLVTGDSKGDVRFWRVESLEELLQRGREWLRLAHG
jgi:hypothetical protein